MIKLNENGTVRFAGIKSEMLAIRTLVEQVFNYYGYALVITAGTEEFDENGKLYHKIGSKHPKGEAEDYRTLGIPTPVADMVYRDVENALTPEYQVVRHTKAKKPTCILNLIPKRPRSLTNRRGATYVFAPNKEKTMHVNEIPFVRRPTPKHFHELNLEPGTDWSGPIQFPQPIRFNGKLCVYFNLSAYGATRLSAGKDGKYHYLVGDTTLPESIGKTDSGWILIPWGENIRLTGCGASVALYEQDDTIVIDYVVKNAGDPQTHYTYRIEFPLREPNIIRIYYLKCVKEINTYVGVAMAPSEFLNVELREFIKKALEFDCSTAGREEIIKPQPEPTPEPEPDVPEPQPTPPSTPFGPAVPKPSDSDANDWRTVYKINDVNYAYRLQRRYQL